MYQVGDMVLLHRSDTYIGRAAKLGFPWTGPYGITKVQGVDVDLISLHVCTTAPVDPFQVHMHRIKPFTVQDD